MCCKEIFWILFLFCLLQVKSGTIFDNILITDDEAHAEAVGEETWGATKDAEKKMKDEQDEEERKQREAEEAARKEAGEDDEEELDEDMEEPEVRVVLWYLLTFETIVV